MSAAELKGYSKLAFANGRENSEEVAELHFLIRHISDLFERGKILDKLLNGINNEYLTLIIGVTEDNVVVYVDIINEIKHVNEIGSSRCLACADLLVNSNVLVIHHSLYLVNSCINLSKSVSDGRKHSIVKSLRIIVDQELDRALVKSCGSKEVYVIISSEGIVVNSKLCLNLAKTLVVDEVVLHVASAVMIDKINKHGCFCSAGLVRLIRLVKIKLLVEINGDNVLLIFVEHLLHLAVKLLGCREIGDVDRSCNNGCVNKRANEIGELNNLLVTCHNVLKELDKLIVVLCAVVVLHVDTESILHNRSTEFHGRCVFFGANDSVNKVVKHNVL